jgi:hypothetical protein
LGDDHRDDHPIDDERIPQGREVIFLQIRNVQEYRREERDAEDHRSIKVFFPKTFLQSPTIQIFR